MKRSDSQEMQILVIRKAHDRADCRILHSGCNLACNSCKVFTLCSTLVPYLGVREYLHPLYRACWPLCGGGPVSRGAGPSPSQGNIPGRVKINGPPPPPSRPLSHHHDACKLIQTVDALAPSTLSDFSCIFSSVKLMLICIVGFLFSTRLTNACSMAGKYAWMSRNLHINDNQ